MKKIYIFAVIILSFFIFSGCANKAVKPVVNAYTLEDLNYPCMKVDFSDQIRYIDMSTVKDGDNIALLYNLEMPGYDVNVIKMYALQGSYSLESLPSLYDNPSKLYEITNTENPDKSAVIVLEDKKEGIYLKGSVGYFIQSDRIVRVDIIRVIKKSGTFRYSGLEEWQNSTIGKRTIENMKSILETVYSSITTTSCPNKKDLNSNWWD
ncbi:MAG: hypothetical protein MSA07_09245 [Mucispirillum sp.]|uniref:Lipoprotein n=1 Tax=Candidatus Mucispirillum faecigallinarum TaxID=2838699 RepID=A0A9D2KB67_9BACT|nr:hypothetical protein [Mucispirillum sp.]HIZ90079.1 hypothetical protein [Candidatus Mucispirillum faecigallinarum]